MIQIFTPRFIERCKPAARDVSVQGCWVQQVASCVAAAVPWPEVASAAGAVAAVVVAAAAAAVVVVVVAAAAVVVVVVVVGSWSSAAAAFAAAATSTASAAPPINTKSQSSPLKLRDEHHLHQLPAVLLLLLLRLLQGVSQLLDFAQVLLSRVFQLLILHWTNSVSNPNEIFLIVRTNSLLLLRRQQLRSNLLLLRATEHSPDLTRLLLRRVWSHRLLLLLLGLLLLRVHHPLGADHPCLLRTTHFSCLRTGFIKQD
jgi:hypothetical protein